MGQAMTIQIPSRQNIYYHCAVGMYLLHMAVMATLTAYYPEQLMRFRIPSFFVVTVALAVAIGYRVISQGIPLRTLLFYLLFLLAMLLGFVWSSNNWQPLLEMVFSGTFVKHVLLFSAVFIYEDAPDVRFRQITFVAAATLLVYQIGIWEGALETGLFHYMTVGYGCAPWWLVLLQGIFYFPKILEKMICGAFCGYFAVIIASYGNRGALLLLVLAISLSLIVWLPLSKLVLWGSIGVLVLTGTLVFLQPLLELGGQYLGVDLTQSRNFQLLLAGRLTYDSGRFPIWEQCIRAILNRPLIGHGVGSDRSIVGDSYAHNILIELCVDFGLVIGFLVYGWLLYIGYRMLFQCQEKSWKALFFPFYVYSMIELLLSGSLWESGYLVASVVIYLAYSTKNLPGKENTLEYSNCSPKIV